jgi:peptidoglycan hydrolase-like protein with peptidoglycan-binding domain
MSLTAATAAVLTTTLTSVSALANSVTNPTSSTHSVTQLQRELATLGYLPLTESFQWRYNEPSSLKALWKTGSYNVMTKGAVMEFQSANHLAIDGIAGPKTWTALDKAYHEKRMNPYGYTYVLVSEKSPETLQIWTNGKLVLTSLANTGISQRPTAVGTFPVYLRYYSQTMSGTNPDGTHYSDPGVPYVNYFYGGDAIHGFWRKSYGFPQSLGCVELPVSQAKIAWSYINYGTLVTVQRGGTPTSNPSGSYSHYPNLHEGIYNNSYVMKLQKILGITADGDFGPKTLTAVKRFQQAHGLVVDGIVGPKTWNALLS